MGSDLEQFIKAWDDYDTIDNKLTRVITGLIINGTIITMGDSIEDICD